MEWDSVSERIDRTTQLKLGLSERLDLEAFYAPISAQVPGTAPVLSRDFALRAKLLVLAGNDDAWLLTLVPLVAGSRHTLNLAGGSLFFGYELPSGLELELNVGAFADLSGAASTLVVTSAATWPITDELAAFVQLFTDSPLHDSNPGAGQARASGTCDTGVLYLVARDVQVDAGAYFGLYGDAALATFFLGSSLRL